MSTVYVATQNYPAWLDAIEGARRHVHFENYFISDDPVGARFADALVRARRGTVRLAYDWLGACGQAGRRLWKRLTRVGVDPASLCLRDRPIAHQLVALCATAWRRRARGKRNAVYVAPT